MMTGTLHLRELALVLLVNVRTYESCVDGCARGIVPARLSELLAKVFLPLAVFASVSLSAIATEMQENHLKISDSNQSKWCVRLYLYKSS